jgi:predicted transporter
MYEWVVFIAAVVTLVIAFTLPFVRKGEYEGLKMLVLVMLGLLWLVGGLYLPAVEFNITSNMSGDVQLLWLGVLVIAVGLWRFFAAQLRAR